MSFDKKIDVIDPITKELSDPNIKDINDFLHGKELDYTTYESEYKKNRMKNGYII